MKRRKLLADLLACAMGLTLAACGGGEEAAAPVAAPESTV